MKFNKFPGDLCNPKLRNKGYQTELRTDMAIILVMICSPQRVVFPLTRPISPIRFMQLFAKSIDSLLPNLNPQFLAFCNISIMTLSENHLLLAGFKKKACPQRIAVFNLQQFTASHVKYDTNPNHVGLNHYFFIRFYLSKWPAFPSFGSIKLFFSAVKTWKNLSKKSKSPWTTNVMVKAAKGLGLLPVPNGHFWPNIHGQMAMVIVGTFIQGSGPWDPRTPLTWSKWWRHMGVSENRGTPKWMIYNGNPY